MHRTRTHSGVVLTCLWSAQFRLGQLEQARELYERALSITGEAFGSDHLKTAAMLTGLATARFELGQPDKARKPYEQASFILHANLPTEHSKIRSLMDALRQIDPEVIVLGNGQIICTTPGTE